MSRLMESEALLRSVSTVGTNVSKIQGFFQSLVALNNRDWMKVVHFSLFTDSSFFPSVCDTLTLDTFMEVSLDPISGVILVSSLIGLRTKKSASHTPKDIYHNCNIVQQVCLYTTYLLHAFVE